MSGCRVGREGRERGREREKEVVFRSCILFLLMIEFASKNVLFFFFFNRITITKKLQDQGFSSVLHGAT